MLSRIFILISIFLISVMSSLPSGPPDDRSMRDRIASVQRGRGRGPGRGGRGPRGRCERLSGRGMSDDDSVKGGSVGPARRASRAGSMARLDHSDGEQQGQCDSLPEGSPQMASADSMPLGGGVPPGGLLPGRQDQWLSLRPPLLRQKEPMSGLPHPLQI